MGRERGGSLLIEAVQSFRGEEKKNKAREKLATPHSSTSKSSCLVAFGGGVWGPFRVNLGGANQALEASGWRRLSGGK